MAISFLAVQELNKRYNDDPRLFTDEEAEVVAGLSKQFGLEFQRESKPLAKAAFDFADIAAFGLLPNTWRPTARGDLSYGETGRDRFAGTLGSIGGLFGATGLAKGLYRGIRGYRAMKDAPGFTPIGGGGGAAAQAEVVRKSAEGITNTGRGLLMPYEGPGSLVPAPLRLGGRLGLTGRLGLSGRLGLPASPLQLTSGSPIDY